MEDYHGLKQQFDADGFVHVEGFMNPEEVEDLEANLARFIRDIVPILSLGDVMYEDQAEPESLKYIGNLQIHDSHFAQFLWNPRIVRLAEALLQDAVVPQHVQFFNKPPGLGKATPAHQDGYYFCLEPNEALTLWLALDNIDDENGALHYVKGSHKKGLFPHSASYVLGFSQGLREGRSTDLGEEVTCRVRRGDCLLHHSLIIHSAEANPSPRQRRAMSSVYYAQRAKEDRESLRRNEESFLSQQKEKPNVRS